MRPQQCHYFDLLSGCRLQPWICFSLNSLHCQSRTYALAPCLGLFALNRYPRHKHCQRGSPTTKALPAARTDLPRPPPQHKPACGIPHESPARKRLKTLLLPDASRPPPSLEASAPRTAAFGAGVPVPAAPGRAPAGPAGAC